MSSQSTTTATTSLIKEIKKKKRKVSLLIEPSIEDERKANISVERMFLNRPIGSDIQDQLQDQSNVIGSKMKARTDKMRSRDRNELTFVLKLLFGCLLIIVCSSTFNQNQRLQVTAASASTRASLFNSSVSQVTTSAPKLRTTASLATNLVSESTSTKETSNREATTTTTSVTVAETTTSNQVVEETTIVPENGSDSEDSDDESAGENDNKLGTFIVETAGATADLFVNRLSGRDQEQPNEEEATESVNNIDRYDNNTDKLVLTTPPEVGGLIAEREAKEEPRLANERELKLAMETYAKWRSTGNDIIELFSRKVLPLIMEHGYDVDPVTLTGVLQVFNAIRALKPWALKIIDASAKLTPGILVGTQSDFGDFDECINVRVDDPSGLAKDFAAEIDESTGLETSTVVGRYCIADIEFPKPPRTRLASRNEELQTDFAPIELRRPLLNFSQTAAYKDTIFVETGNFFHMLYVDPLRVGVCLTNKIDPDSFAKVFNKIVEDFKVKINFHGRCVTKYDKPSWTIYQKVSAYVLIAACSLVSLCTILDLVHLKLNKVPLPKSLGVQKVNLRERLFKYRPLFTSFSIIRNTKRLFKPQTTFNAGSSQQDRAKQLNLNLTPVQLPSNSSSSSQDSSSSESSPSIERRSSVTSSALNLISEPSSLSVNQAASQQQTHAGKAQKLIASFNSAPIRARRENNLLCLHGIRVITMTWMIVNHTYLFGGFFVLWAHRRLIDIAEWPKSVSFQLVLNGWLTVETYFFLSAAIIVLNVMPLMKSNKFAYFPYILHRLVRLLPAYVGLVCLNFLWPLVSTGPVWLVKGKSFIQTPCENYLWTNFLFINNWIWPEKQCMVHTWFLSADFQLYLLAPIIVYLLCRRPVFGHSLNIIIALIASIFSGFIIYANKLMPTTLINKLEFDSIKQQLSYSYMATYQHMGPYCLGIFIGYLLHNRPQVRLPKHLTWMLWLFLPPLSFTTLLLTYLWNGAYDDPALINPSPLVSAFYVAIHRTIWTSLLAWIVFACATGRAKLMSNFLSHSMFIPISRLSFSIYLVHLPVIMFRALNLRHTIEWTDSNILWEACGNFIVSLIVGYFVNITFESPIINLEAVIFGRAGRDEKRAKFQCHNQKPCHQEEAPKGRSFLRPQVNLSKANSEDNYNSDDNKSAESSEHQPASSIETQDRKLSDSSAIDPTIKLEEELPKSMQWTQYQGSLKVKALRPKQSPSVEKIFGHQMESASQLDFDSNVLDSLHYTNFRQIAPYNQKRVRRYSSYEVPSALEEPSPDSLYPIASEYQHYARAGYHQQLRPTRVSQYATLARTSRFDHDPTELNRLEYQRPIYVDQSRSQLDEPISRSKNEAVYLMKQRTNLLQRRQGRYNTLTGTGGIKEWRQQQYPDGYQENWPISSGSQAPIWELANTGKSWLQSGTMIPRIDSSTLRRHAKRPETAGSIVEEPTREEREDEAL